MLRAVLVAMLVGAVFAPAVRFDFVNWDDPRYVTGAPHVRAGLTPTGVAAAFGRTADNWHPLTTLSHAAVWQVSGGSPAAHHAVNVVLHAVNAGLVVLALGALTGDPLRATVVALLFALHPLRVESVAWVSERKDVLCACFFLLALWAYARAARRPSLGNRLAVAAAFVAALLAKPMAVTLPVVLLVLDWWPLRRDRSVASLLMEKAPLFALAAATAVVTVLVQQSGGALSTLATLPLAARLANAAVATVRYLGATFWPTGLAFFYPYRAWPPAVVAGTVALLVLLTAGAWTARRRCPYLLAGWLWWLVMLAPVSGIVQTGEQAMADRYTYLPSLGLALALVWGMGDLATAAGRRRAAAALAALAVVAGAVATMRQLPTWRDSETLTRHALAVTTGNYVAHLNLGRALVDRGDYTAARAHYEAAAAIRPDYPPIVVNLGHAALRDGRLDEADASFRRALALRADDPLAANGLGLVAAARGDAPGAIVWYERALAADPAFGEAQVNLADALAASGRVDEAIVRYRALLAGDPTVGFELGNLLFRSGKAGEAIAAWRTTLAAKPEWHDARDNVAVALLALGRPAEAIPELERVVAADPRHQRAQLHLGIALVTVGRRADARAPLRAATALRPDDADAARALADLE